MTKEDVERVVRKARERDERPDLTCTNLERAKLTDVNLSGADLRSANLSGADLRGANLHGANLTGANLRDTSLAGASLRDTNLEGATLPDGVPAVPNIDAAILAAVEAGGKLDMGDWHSCATTHCRAGWAITLAGDAGRALEERFGPNVAGALIYAASGSHPTPNWFTNNEDAMADLRERASRAEKEGGA